MSAVAPSRRIAGRCLFCQPLPRRPFQCQTAIISIRSKSNDTKSSRPNPVLEEYRRNNPEQAAQQAAPQSRSSVAGDLSASSIFEDDRRAQQQAEEYAASQDSAEDGGKAKIGGSTRDPQNMLTIVDPDPNSRERWERKKVIQMVRKGGRLSKAQFIKRTEREHLIRSHNMKTSVKKLGMLARQIAGKTIEDAITQMRFSKKKVAQDVLKQLEYARDEAVVTRGMGLGGVDAQEGATNLNKTSASVFGVVPGASGAESADQAVQIQLKDGKRHTVSDASRIYIDQAWVGRGPYGELPDYRARGQVNIMRTPWTSLTVLLKEEATRVREYEEREAKRRKAIVDKVWTHLPDRPVQWQRQWYTF